MARQKLGLDPWRGLPQASDDISMVQQLPIDQAHIYVRGMRTHPARVKPATACPSAACAIFTCAASCCHQSGWPAPSCKFDQHPSTAPPWWWHQGLEAVAQGLASFRPIRLCDESASTLEPVCRREHECTTKHAVDSLC